MKMSSIVVATMMVAFAALTHAQRGPPQIQADGNNLVVQAGNGDITLQTRQRTCSGSDICDLVASMSTLRSQMNSMADELDPDFVGGTVNTLMADIATRPTNQAANDMFLSPTEGDQNYAPLQDFQTLDQSLSTTTAGIYQELQLINATLSSGIQFPLCAALTAPSNGRVSSHVEHLPGVVVTIGCNSGYILSAGSATSALCLSNQTWRYNGNVPSCIVSPLTWTPVAWTINRYQNIFGGASIFAGGRDFRSGDPNQRTGFQLPTINICQGGGVSGIDFYYQFVTGYGNCGQNCDPNRAPTMKVYIVNADNVQDRMLVYDNLASNHPLYGYDYDTCGNNWGSNDDPNDGCYSPRIHVQSPANTPIALQTASRVYVRFEFANRGRNVHINDDAMNMRIRTIFRTGSNCAA